MTIRFRKTGDWKKFERAIDPRIFKARSRPHVRRATGINGKIGERFTRTTIREGDFKPNAPLTVAIKGSGKKPLIDTSAMRKAITSEIIDDFTAFVGVKRSHKQYNVAHSVHEGTEMKVSAEMRAMFYWLWVASLFVRGMRDKPVILTGRAAELWLEYEGPWRKLERNIIVVPARQFMKVAFERKDFQKLCIDNWEKAIMATLRGLAL